MPKNKGKLLFLAYDSCLTIPGLKIRQIHEGFNCSGFLQESFEYLERQYPKTPIFVINRTGSYIYNQTDPGKIKYSGPTAYFTKVVYTLNEEYLTDFSERYTNSICELAKERQVFITTPVPEMGSSVPKELSRLQMHSGGEHEISIPIQAHLERNKFIRDMMNRTASQCGAELLKTSDYLCDDFKCRGSLAGRPLYYDGDHLSEYGNKFLIPMFENAWDKIQKAL
jgi:hypothetical protein